MFIHPLVALAWPLNATAKFHWQVTIGQLKDPCVDVTINGRRRGTRQVRIVTFEPMDKGVNTVDSRLPFELFDRKVKELRRLHNPTDSPTSDLAFIMDGLSDIIEVNNLNLMIVANLDDLSAFDFTTDGRNIVSQTASNFAVEISLI